MRLLPYTTPQVWTYSKLGLERSSVDSNGDRLPFSSTTTDQEAKAMSSMTWRTRALLLLLWILTAIGTSLFVEDLRQYLHPIQTGVEWKPTEWAPVRDYIERDIWTFTGTAVFEGDDIAYREEAPHVKQYFGDDPKVDDNWKDLRFQHPYFWISEAEAKAHFGKSYKNWYHTQAGWWVGLDVFHTLHCVDWVRKAFEKAIRGEWNATSMASAFHKDHCLDLIRQQIQCSADVTLIPQRRFRNDSNFIDTDQKHTCRNFNKIHEFVKKRRQLSEEIEANIVRETGRDLESSLVEMGVYGFPEREGHYDEFRPAYLKGIPEPRTEWSPDSSA